MSQSQFHNPNSTQKNSETASVISTSTFSSTILLLKSSLHTKESKEDKRERKAREKEDRRKRKEDEKRRWDTKHPDDGKTRTTLQIVLHRNHNRVLIRRTARIDLRFATFGLAIELQKRASLHIAIILALIEWLGAVAFNLALTASPLVWRQIKTMVSSAGKGVYAVVFRLSLFIVMASFSAKKKLRWKGGAETRAVCSFCPSR
ncbi:hypothetical protein OIDMADRAFT_56465 [Oidiodendron maius Zn]|uniref:Uncharacterized protein n=1 Tax=Oidiodendron maius (strain Zn) TaxID=913774 RepID=A0A0C3HAC7_OIDMZ|nr:hypothetical protein OIDMADRAFT_56465 [Oidiodendron maius Zn]